MSRTVSNCFIAFLFIALAGCGFHLRGSVSLPANLKPMYIQGISLNQGFGLELRRSLMANNVELKTDFQQGNAVLTILDFKSERRVLSVGSGAKVSEFQLYGSVDFTLSDNTGQMVIESDKVQAVRDYQFDQNQVLASDQQEIQLRQELNKQLVQSLVRRISALK
jgi:LPS-assembly lipoprotein